jgi:NAD+ kinase
MRTKTIGLIAHTEKAGVAKLARDVIREFKERSLKVIVENQTAKIAKQKASGSIAQIAQRSDLIVVLGGDGTILNVVAMASKNLKPIFGINVGSLGFLTTVNSSAYREVVDAIVSGRISYSKRALLSVELRTNRRVLSSVHALNDAVISRGDLPRLIRLNAKVNGEALTGVQRRRTNYRDADRFDRVFAFRRWPDPVSGIRRFRHHTNLPARADKSFGHCQ